jgi:hypothetical protein
MLMKQKKKALPKLSPIRRLALVILLSAVALYILTR